mmetsp:Transcript_20161/g.44007  ORF Transcript_20161/g.44007 Transcript_20161/m.44007 type:complete len:209 (-) Transcript_20161:50-676(-)
MAKSSQRRKRECSDWPTREDAVMSYGVRVNTRNKLATKRPKRAKTQTLETGQRQQRLPHRLQGLDLEMELLLGKKNKPENGGVHPSTISKWRSYVHYLSRLKPGNTKCDRELVRTIASTIQSAFMLSFLALQHRKEQREAIGWSLCILLMNRCLQLQPLIRPTRTMAMQTMHQELSQLHEVRCTCLQSHYLYFRMTRPNCRSSDSQEM